MMVLTTGAFAQTTVGIVLPTKDEPRWIQDQTRFQDALKTAGISAEVMFSQGDSAKEKANVETLITKGIKVLVICPQDSAAAAAAADAAKKAKVKVISYDRLITGTSSVDFYVTFDSFNVGAAWGQFLVSKATGKGNNLYLYAGAASDNNAFIFFEGAWETLQPKIADGTFKIINSSEAIALQKNKTLTRDQEAKIIGQVTTNWNPADAKSKAEANLTSAKAADKGTVFILAPNDGTARAIADVYAVDTQVKKYFITGQDAEKASIQYIIDGKQSMTVLKDVRVLVNDAIQAAITFSKGQTPAVTKTYDNGKIKVPAKPSDVTTVTKDNVKAAVFVNVSSNLVVYSGNGSVNVSTDVGYKIDPTRWYRLTILMGKVGDETAAFQVYVNDVLITNAVAITQDFNSNGTWFYSASAVNTISAVAFQGTGMVDDLVVTTLANGYGIPAAIALTLSFNDTLVSVTKGGTTVANSGTINSGDEIVIDAHDWYGITSVAGTTAVYGGATGARVNVSTGTVTAASAETVTIGVTQYSSGTVSTGAGSIDANKLSTWALAKGVSESALSGMAWYDDYLLNVGVGTDAKLKIASITVGESLATIVITTDKPGTVTSLAGINGTLKYYTTDSLGTAFSGATAISVTGAGTSVTTTVPLTAGKFIKATIE